MPLAPGLFAYSNGIPAMLVLEKRVLQYAIQPGFL